MTEDLEDPRSIPELREQASMLPGVIERELMGTFRSAEFRFLGSPINQMQLLRTQPRKFTLQIIVNLFGEPLITLSSALKRLRVLKEAVNSESGNAADFSGPNSRLTWSEELNVTG